MVSFSFFLAHFLPSLNRKKWHLNRKEVGSWFLHLFIMWRLQNHCRNKALSNTLFFFQLHYKGMKKLVYCQKIKNQKVVKHISKHKKNLSLCFNYIITQDNGIPHKSLNYPLVQMAIQHIIKAISKDESIKSFSPLVDLSGVLVLVVLGQCFE